MFFFFENRTVYEKMWNEHKMHCCASTARIVMQTRHIVTFHGHCLPC